MKTQFMKGISDGDLLTTRLFLANEMMLDPNGKGFAKMCSLAEMNVESLYERHSRNFFNN